MTAAFEIDSDSAEVTRVLASRLAAVLLPGDVLALDGDLGAGKTCFVTGLAGALGCGDGVSSPTFTILMAHPTASADQMLYHFDVYRLNGAADFKDAGLADYFDAGGFCLIEWADRIRPLLPPHTIYLRIKRQEAASDSYETAADGALVLPSDHAARRLVFSGPVERIAAIRRALAPGKETPGDVE